MAKKKKSTFEKHIEAANAALDTAIVELSGLVGNTATFIGDAYTIAQIVSKAADALNMAHGTRSSLAEVERIINPPGDDSGGDGPSAPSGGPSGA